MTNDYMKYDGSKSEPPYPTEGEQSEASAERVDPYEHEACHCVNNPHDGHFCSVCGKSVRVSAPSPTLTEDELIAERDQDWCLALSEIDVAALATSKRHGKIEVTRADEESPEQQVAETAKPCECVCHEVGLFGLMCCPCTTRELHEFVNGKPSTPQAPVEVSAPSPILKQRIAALTAEIERRKKQRDAAFKEGFKAGVIDFERENERLTLLWNDAEKRLAGFNMVHEQAERLRGVLRRILQVYRSDWSAMTAEEKAWADKYSEDGAIKALIEDALR